MPMRQPEIIGRCTVTIVEGKYGYTEIQEGVRHRSLKVYR